MRLYFPTDHVDGWPRQWISNVIEQLKQQQQSGYSELHALADHPDDADAIVFNTYGIEPLTSDFYQPIREHAVVRRSIEKCFLWCDKDLPLPLLPGIYASLPHHLFNPKIHQAFCYSKVLNSYLEDQFHQHIQPEHLFSFAGSVSSPVRGKLLKMQWNSTDGIVLPQKSLWNGIDFGDHQAELKSYAELLSRSWFVLCPRGNGQSSYRIFEAMQVGRVPVIIADRWVAPAEIDWASCSVRIRENQLHQIPKILNSYRAQASEMGSCARQMWQQWFSPERQLYSIGEAIMRIQPQICSPDYIRQTMQQSIKRYQLEMLLTSGKLAVGRMKKQFQKFYASN